MEWRRMTVVMHKAPLLASLLPCLLCMAFLLCTAVPLRAAAADEAMGPDPMAIALAIALDWHDPSLDSLLRQEAALLTAHPQASLRIVAHTWRRGGEAINRALSLRRALECKAFLVTLGVSPSQVVLRGEGGRRPLPGQDPRDAANFRLEFTRDMPRVALPRVTPRMAARMAARIGADAAVPGQTAMAQATLPRASIATAQAAQAARRRLDKVREGMARLAPAQQATMMAAASWPAVAVPAPAVSQAMAPAAAPAITTAPAASMSAEPAVSHVLPFGQGRVKMAPEALEPLKALAAALLLNPQARAVLAGHSDAAGDDVKNMEISRQRAETVRDALAVAFGIDRSRLEAIGLGESQPVSQGDGEAQRAANRRVVAEVYLPRDVALIPPPIPSQAAAMAAPRPLPAMTEAVSAEMLPAAMRLSDQTPHSPLAVQSVGLPGSPGSPVSSVAMPAMPRLLIAEGEVIAVPQESTRYTVEVSISKCSLWLYENQPDGNRKLVKQYRVATAKNGMDHPEGPGFVTRIDTNPWWFPTPDMKRRAASSGKTLAPVPPGEKGNPMGSVKIHLSHGPAYRIHGTNRPEQIGQRVSQGCIRMHNKDGLELAKILSVGTEVNVAF